jgi:hypothetical protein
MTEQTIQTLCLIIIAVVVLIALFAGWNVS